MSCVTVSSKKATTGSINQSFNDSIKLLNFLSKKSGPRSLRRKAEDHICQGIHQPIQDVFITLHPVADQAHGCHPWLKGIHQSQSNFKIKNIQCHVYACCIMLQSQTHPTKPAKKIVACQRLTDLRPGLCIRRRSLHVYVLVCQPYCRIRIDVNCTQDALTYSEQSKSNSEIITFTFCSLTRKL